MHSHSLPRPEPVSVNLLRSPGIVFQPGRPVPYDNPVCRTGPPGYIGWRNRFLGIDSWAPETFTNTTAVLIGCDKTNLRNLRCISGIQGTPEKDMLRQVTFQVQPCHIYRVRNGGHQCSVVRKGGPLRRFPTLEINFWWPIDRDVSERISFRCMRYLVYRRAVPWWSYSVRAYGRWSTRRGLVVLERKPPPPITSKIKALFYVPADGS